MKTISMSLEEYNSELAKAKADGIFDGKTQVINSIENLIMQDNCYFKYGDNDKLNRVYTTIREKRLALKSYYEKVDVSNLRD